MTEQPRTPTVAQRSGVAFFPRCTLFHAVRSALHASGELLFVPGFVVAHGQYLTVVAQCPLTASLPAFVVPASVTAGLFAMLAVGEQDVRVEVTPTRIQFEAFEFATEPASIETLRRMYTIVEPPAPKFDIRVNLGTLQATLKLLLAEATESYHLSVQTWLLTDREGPASLAIECEEGRVAEVPATVIASTDPFPSSRFRAHAVWRALETLREHLNTSDTSIRLFHGEERCLHFGAGDVRCLVDPVS